MEDGFDVVDEANEEVGFEEFDLVEIEGAEEAVTPAEGGVCVEQGVGLGLGLGGGFVDDVFEDGAAKCVESAEWEVEDASGSDVGGFGVHAIADVVGCDGLAEGGGVVADGLCVAFFVDADLACDDCAHGVCSRVRKKRVRGHHTWGARKGQTWRELAMCANLRGMSMKVVMIGDIVGKPGRRVVQQQIPVIRERWAPDLIVANGENIAGGSGITPQLHKKLLSYGVDGVTLGDHCFRQRDLIPVIDSVEKLIRPINLAGKAKGGTVLRLERGEGEEPLYVITVLGRLFMNGGPLADDPFAAVDKFLEEYPGDGSVIVEAHMETTSEKMALAHYLDGRVAGVFGSHTHVPTADARVLSGGTAFITDMGMCGPYDSVLGRRKDRVVKFMSTGMPAPFDVAGDGDDVKVCGVYVEIGDDRKAVKCERVEFEAELDRAPFGEGG